MKNLILIGGGGHCRACIDVIEATGLYKIKGILDKPAKLGNLVLNYEVIGNDEDLDFYIQQKCYFLIALGQIGSSTHRNRIFLKLREKNAMLATIYSPFAYISPTANIGLGTIVMHGAIINTNTEIGDNCIINSNSLVEHDSVIHGHCHISTGAIVNGGVNIGKGSFVGSGSVIIQGCNIHASSFIKAGSVFNGNKNIKIAFLTTLFPVSKSIIDDYMLSLVNQTYTNFDLLLLNDGYGSISSLKDTYPELNIIEINTKNNIAKNRAELINYAISNHYDIAIFGDIDDFFSANRISKTLNKLNDDDIVINDFTTINSDGVIDRLYISNRYINNSKITISDIMDKNIFGFTNTAVKLSKLKNLKFDFKKNLTAVDWYFFSLLLNNGLTALFTNETETFYRQHDDNIAGIHEINECINKRNIRVKKQHYSEMFKIQPVYKHFLDNISLSKQTHLKKNVTVQNQIITHPLWWETSQSEDK